MQRTIQFESIVENGMIRIPEQYVRQVPSNVTVTLAPASQTRVKFTPKTKEMPATIDEFPAFLDTTGWKFNRGEANERR
jgi:hypothetical protein